MGVKIGTVTGRKIAINRDGDVPGRILQAVTTSIRDVQNVQTCQNGDEYNPANGTTLIIVSAGEAYKIAVAGDDGIAPVMEPGGHRVYATDPTGANVMAEAQLHPDGKIELLNAKVTMTMLPDGKVTVENGAGSFTMNSDGSFIFAGISSHFDHPVTMASTLAVTTSVTAPLIAGTADVTFAGKSAKDHTHTTTTTGNPTGVPL